MVDVAMREDRGVEPLRSPRLHRVVHGLRLEDAARVDDDEPRVGVGHGRVGERVDEGQARLHLDEFPGWAGQRMVVGSGQITREQAVRLLQEVHDRRALPQPHCEQNRNVF